MLLLVLFAGTQLSAQTQSLGDVAREQKEIRKQREKDAENTKVLTNEDLASGSATSTSGTTNSGTANSPSISPITQDQSAGNESAVVKIKHRGNWKQKHCYLARNSRFGP